MSAQANRHTVISNTENSSYQTTSWVKSQAVNTKVEGAKGMHEYRTQNSWFSEL